jgi:hypothetical protein
MSGAFDERTTMKRSLKLWTMAAALSAAAIVPALAADGGGYDPNYWVRLGTERFQGPVDREAAFPGWGGRSVDRIGLRSLNGFARCTRVRAMFGNGNTRDLDASGLFRMVPGRVYRVDLPGGDRNVVRLALKCRALGQYAVAVDVFARK